MPRHKLSLATLVLVPLACCRGVADDAPPKQRVSLMGMLLEWRYPESEFHGAESADAAVTGVSAIKSKAVLTTPDSARKVLDFYCRKLKVDAEGKRLDEKEGQRLTTGQSVLIQDVSGGRASKLYVIAINETRSSTTLVVSRTEGDDVTRIAWSNYRQLSP